MKKTLVFFLFILAWVTPPALRAESGRLIWQASWYNTPQRADPIRSLGLGGPIQPMEKGASRPITGQGPLRGYVVTDGDVSIKLLSIHRISPSVLGIPAAQRLDFELEEESASKPEDKNSRNQILFKTPALSFRERDVFMVIFETQKAGDSPVRQVKALTLTLNLVMS